MANILVRLAALAAGVALAEHAPSMNNQFLDLTSATTETVILFQIAFIVLGVGVFLLSD